MNHMSGINRKLNQNDGREIVDYINKRIAEKAAMEQRGIPFFKADSSAFESQDIKRLTVLDKVFKKRISPVKHKRVKELKITSNHKPFWWELTGFMNMTKSVAKKDRAGKKTTEIHQRSLSVLPATFGHSNISPGPSSSSSEPSPGSSIGTIQLAESLEDDGIDEHPFGWKYKDFFDC